MELFAFIETGGASERITVIELEKGVSVALAKFDGGEANCFLPKDKQKLLAVIEAGFGNMVPFNKTVRAILKDRVEVLDDRSPPGAAYVSSTRGWCRLLDVGVPDADGVPPAIIELRQLS